MEELVSQEGGEDGGKSLIPSPRPAGRVHYMMAGSYLSWWRNWCALHSLDGRMEDSSLVGEREEETMMGR